jgi:Uma2 family endonuclease
MAVMTHPGKEDEPMATVTPPAAPATAPQELENGDHMTQPEFHRIYSQMRDDFKAELIGGIVYVASPLKARHGRNHLPLGTVFFLYEAQTPGVECFDNTTVILGGRTEPQPDLLLRIRPDSGGQSRTTAEDFIEGPPELIAEIASTSHAIDLHIKRDAYAQHGVLEYLVVNVRDGRLHWFDLRAGRELSPDADGVYRLKTFPGLWVHGDALFARDSRRLLATLDGGLATQEHAAFVEQLAKARQT